MGAIGGVVTGYILWLAAISVGDGLTTVSQWSRVVLLLSVLVAVCGAAGGLRLQPRQARVVGVCFQFADSSRGADRGGAGRHLPLTATVGCPAGWPGR